MIVDIILIAVLLIAVAVSAKKGIVQTILQIAALMLTLVLAAQAAAPTAKMLYSSFMAERIETKIEDTLSSGEAATNAKKAAALTESLPGFAQSYLARNGVDTNALAQEIASGQAAADTAAYLTDTFAKPICETALTGVLFLLVSFVLGGLLQLLANAISKVFKLPIIKTANAALGGVFGLLKGAVLVYLAVALLVYIAPRQSTGSLAAAVQDSRVVAFTQQYLPESIFGEGI